MNAFLHVLLWIVAIMAAVFVGLMVYFAPRIVRDRLDRIRERREDEAEYARLNTARSREFKPYVPPQQPHQHPDDDDLRDFPPRGPAS